MKLLIALTISVFITATWAGRLPAVPQRIPLETYMKNYESRITNGYVAQPREIPWQAALLLTVGLIIYFCGGSVLSPEFILTAAHCADNATHATVILGATRIDDPSEVGQIRVSANTFIVHEGWNSGSLINDIALVHLTTPITWTNHIQPITLPVMDGVYEKYVGKEARVSGWGLTSSQSQNVSDVLLFAPQCVITNAQCNSQFLGSVTDSMICGQNLLFRSPCSGDSGGPLTYYDHQSGEPKQIGIVSFGLALSCQLGWPSVFTRVTSFLTWIYNKTGIANQGVFTKAGTAGVRNANVFNTFDNSHRLLCAL